MYFKDEVLTFIEEENVQFIKLLFLTCLAGRKMYPFFQAECLALSKRE